MKKLHKYIIFILLAVLFMKHTIPYLQDIPIFQGYMTMRTNVFFSMIFFLLIEMLDAEWGKWKHESDKILADNIGSSITSSKKDNETAGPWTAFRLGGLMAVGMAVAGKEGTLITHRLAIKEKEGGVMVEGKAEQFEKEELPPDVKEMVDKKDLPEPYYFTTTPPEVERQSQTYITKKSLWKSIQKLKNRKVDLVEDIQEISREAVNFKQDISQNKTKGAIKKLEEKVESMDEE